MITLEPVSHDNYLRVVRLNVKDSQRNFVASNAFSLAQAYAMRECVPLAVCLDGEPIGFAMYCFDADENQYAIYRLMIDRKHQHQGYGRTALGQLLDRIRALDPARHVVYISFEPENKAAKALYESVGFVSDGRMWDNEVVYRLEY